MSDRDELKQWLEQTRPDLPGGEVVDILCERYRGPGTQFSPADVEERFPPEREREVLATLQLLAKKKIGVLRGQWLFIDAAGDEFELDQGDVDEALKTREFFHPLSGDPVYNYEEAIRLVYEPGTNFPARAVTRTQTPGIRAR